MIARESVDIGDVTVAVRVFWISRGGPGGAVHGGARESNGRDPEARKGRGGGREPEILYIGLFEQVKRPGGAVPGGGEDFLILLYPQVRSRFLKGGKMLRE